jgi:hypothetical protein
LEHLTVKGKCMSSLVEELQRDALNPIVRVSDLLRKAKTIAYKLDLPELAKWVESELSGYSDTASVPKYRVLKGRVKGHNPYHGWQPVIFGDESTEDAFSNQPIGQKVAELEDVSARSENGTLMVPLSSQAKQLLMRATGMELDFALMVSASAPVGILDAVRNALLDWSLKLEKSGIRGDGMSFSSEERKKAHETQAVYNIGNIQTFTGNMGSGSGNFSVKGNTVNAESKAAVEALVGKIRANEGQLGLAPTSAQELHQALDGIQNEMKSPKPSGSRIHGYLASIRNIAEGVAGSLAAQGILYELSKLMPQ